MEDASSLRYGCIMTVCGVSAFIVDTQAILQRRSVFFRDCLHEGREPKLAGLLMPWVKEVFILFFSKSNRFFMTFMPGKCFLKNNSTSYDIVLISWHM